MNHIKLFEEFGILDYFKKKDSTKSDQPDTNMDGLNIFIDKDPYETSQFGQEKYSVYVKGDSSLYYIGDVRKWPNTDSYLSYLRFDKAKKVNRINIEPISGKPKEIVAKEIDDIYFASDFEDDEITNGEYLKKLLNNG